MATNWLRGAAWALVMVAPHSAWADDVPEAATLKEAPGPTAAPAVTLTLKQAYVLALRAPGARVAQALRPEAEAARVDAQIFPRKNPVLEVGVGPRIVNLEPTPTVSLSLMQSVDLGGGVTARAAAAVAAADRAGADGDAATQALLREVGLAFVRTLWAEEQLAQASELVTLAEDTRAATELRQKGGDVSRLEIGVAKLGVARAKAEMRRREADRESALGRLHVLLGVPQSSPIAVKGSLSELEALSLGELEKRAKERPDLAALAAELRGARAEAELGDALAAPELGFGVRYDHEEDSDTVQGVLSLSLPIFDHGQGLRARAEATERRTRIDLDAATTTLPIALRAAFDTYERRVAAARALESEVAAPFEENLALTKRSFEAGESSLSEVLVLRREIAEGRVDYLDRLLEAREAGIALRAEAGVLP